MCQLLNSAQSLGYLHLAAVCISVLVTLTSSHVLDYTVNTQLPLNIVVSLLESTQQVILKLILKQLEYLLTKFSDVSTVTVVFSELNSLKKTTAVAERH